MRKHLAYVRDQLLQKGELYWRQPHLHPLKSHDMPRKVDLEVAKSFYAASKWYRLRLGTAQHGTHARRAYDLHVYELDDTPGHQFIWPYVFHYPGLTLLRSLTLQASRTSALVRDGRAGDAASC